MSSYLSLGSNLGSRSHYLSLGVEVIADGGPYRLSRVYETEPQGGVVQDDFWNLVMALPGEHDPFELLRRAQVAEAAAARVREQRWGPRTLDVDVIWCDDVTVETAQLTVPHPRMWERAFVLVPLAELAPHLVGPEQLAAARGAVRALGTLEELG